MKRLKKEQQDKGEKPRTRRDAICHDSSRRNRSMREGRQCGLSPRRRLRYRCLLTPTDGGLIDRRCRRFRRDLLLQFLDPLPELGGVVGRSLGDGTSDGSSKYSLLCTR